MRIIKLNEDKKSAREWAKATIAAEKAKIAGSNIDEKLTEDSDSTDNAAIEKATSINPQSSSAEEIADAVKNGVNAATGEETVSPEAANQLGASIKSDAEKINADSLAFLGKFGGGKDLKIENDLTKTLDKALRVARFNVKHGRKSGANVLVVGMPGSSKTASVYNWAANNNINVFYLDAKNNDLKAVINGFMVTKTDASGKITGTTQGYSNALDGLDEPNTVLFLDELNRQADTSLRGSLLTLINEKYVPCAKTPENPTGRHYFTSTLLFTVACINPAASNDIGATELSPVERDRFAFKQSFDSTVESAKSFFNTYLGTTINNQLKYLKDTSITKEEREDALETLFVADREKRLANTILDDSLFSFTNRSEIDDLYHKSVSKTNPITNQEYTKVVDYSYVTQRSLSDMIDASMGEVDMFLDMVDANYNDDDFTKENKEMFHEILDDYKDETDEQILEKHGLSGSKGEDNSQGTPKDVDDKVFGSGNSVAVDSDSIVKAMDSWR